MTNAEFIEYIYRRVLQRPVDKEARLSLNQSLEDGSMSRDQITATLVGSKEFDALAASAEFVPTGHFFSAVTNAHDRTAIQRRSSDASPPAEIDFRYESQWELLESFLPFLESFPFTEEKSPDQLYYLNNPAFGYADGIWLHCMLRVNRPKRVVEVGSGHSTCMLLDTKRIFLNSKTKISCIEPYPELLQNLVGKDIALMEIHPEKVQETSLEKFDQLEAGDILLVDSSHVSKTGSDVNHIVFEILPRLKPGVIIHFHDIYWPFEYPNDWIQEGRCWNEAYLLRAFLAHNSSYNVLLYPNSLYPNNLAWFEKRVPLSLKVKGGSLWIQKS